MALELFRDMAADELDTLGVEVVEGNRRPVPAMFVSADEVETILRTSGWSGRTVGSYRLRSSRRIN